MCLTGSLPGDTHWLSRIRMIQSDSSFYIFFLSHRQQCLFSAYYIHLGLPVFELGCSASLCFGSVGPRWRCARVAPVRTEQSQGLPVPYDKSAFCSRLHSTHQPPPKPSGGLACAAKPNRLLNVLTAFVPNLVHASGLMENSSRIMHSFQL